MKPINTKTRLKKLSVIKQLVNFVRIAMLPKKVNHGSNIRILGKNAYFKLPKNGFVSLGNNVVLNSDEKNSNTALTTRCKFVTGYEGKIIIGDNCDLNGTCIVSYEEVSIGNHCQFASSSLISDTDFHPVDSEARLAQMNGDNFDFNLVNKAKISIGNNCWFGWGAVVLKGVTIGNNCIIGAGAIVISNSTFPDNCLIAGNPAKIIKKI